MTGENLILSPLITEKGTAVGEEGNQVVFRVRPEASKDAIRDVVERIDSLHFPIAGMIGLFAVMADGRTVVLATTGREGFPGVTAFFAGEVAPLRALVLVQGRCVCFRSQASATNTPHGPTVCRCSSPLWQ